MCRKCKTPTFIAVDELGTRRMLESTPVDCGAFVVVKDGKLPRIRYATSDEIRSWRDLAEGAPTYCQHRCHL